MKDIKQYKIRLWKFKGGVLESWIQYRLFEWNLKIIYISLMVMKEKGVCYSVSCIIKIMCKTFLILTLIMYSLWFLTLLFSYNFAFGNEKKMFFYFVVSSLSKEINIT
jgi:hypothetical protein